MDQVLTQSSVTILCDSSNGCDEMDNYFATETDTILYIDMRLT